MGRHTGAVQLTVVVLLCNLVLGAAVLIFAAGFFPHKAVLPGLATWPADTPEQPSAPFDRVIFMVVDALRSDFVYGNGSKFHFTQSLITSGAAVPFTGHASPPTITMPRVKAITTGSVPSFLDLVLNFAESDTTSTLSTQDSWLAQLRNQPDGALVMYGDDTWLRLFPGFFKRADGTTSFFVSDFTEVDNNVTRHIPDELKRDDWNGMIMHFLGLDHIGHKTGPRGPNMPAKQQEMDDVVRQIYTAMETEAHLQSALLVLLGDHGMNEGGNHGANSAGEVSTALTFISPQLKRSFPNGFICPAPFQDDFRYYQEVDQSDLAPTLAALLGFPVPKNSLGTIIPQILDLWSDKADQYRLISQNARQIFEVARATYSEAFQTYSDPSSCIPMEDLSGPAKLACRWLNAHQFDNKDLDGSNIEHGISLFRSFLHEAQGQLSGTASQYDLRYMYAGVGLLSITLLGPGIWLLRQGATFQPATLLTFSFTVLMYAITMFASSYVEEEHQYWYWVASAWILILTIKARRYLRTSNVSAVLSSNLSICLGFGLMRRWNQTGQKYAGEADLVTEILQQHRWLLWFLIFLTYTLVSRQIRLRPARLGARQLAILPVLVVTSAFLFKIAFTAAEAPELLKNVVLLNPVVEFTTRYPLISLARVSFLGLANLVGMSLYIEKPWKGSQHVTSFLESVHDIVTLFLITQTRTVNIPLFIIFHIQLKVLKNGRHLHPSEALLTMLFMQYASFFAFGGTNAISSIDLSNAYNGISGYNVVAVGILTFVGNWIGPIWWASATACVLGTRIDWGCNSNTSSSWYGVLTFFAMVHAAAVMVACIVLREHLFIWTVFSPKYLYMMAWTFAQHMVINGVFAAVSASAPR